ncbi:hypothetical protein Tco_1045345 [Tanacetum coccineum]|uniref:Uncharacterized protein n=1 Tax=Tanacetum coccineum TaxID=301880 RepID=A0ABQ5GSL9_9ASTR
MITRLTPLAIVEGFAAEADNKRNNYDIAINNVMESVEKIKGARVDERNTLLKALNIVSETLEADSALKAIMQQWQTLTHPLLATS